MITGIAIGVGFCFYSTIVFVVGIVVGAKIVQ